MQQRGMALQFEITAQNGEALSFVVIFTEKEIQKEDTNQKSDVLEKEFIVDIKRLARERRMAAGTHCPPGAVKVHKSGGPTKLQKAQSGGRLRKSCMKQGGRSQNERAHGTRIVRKVRKGRRTSGHVPKSYERKAAKMTETGKFLQMTSDEEDNRRAAGKEEDTRRRSLTEFGVLHAVTGANKKKG